LRWLHARQPGTQDFFCDFAGGGSLRQPAINNAVEPVGNADYKTTPQIYLRRAVPAIMERRHKAWKTAGI
jgi:hypothetical protein